ncbi:MAG: HAD-IA family hydrolase [Acidobacteriota bacterium]
MPPTPRKLLLVFDLDGTLIDSVRDLAASASELAVALGGRALPADEVAGMVGDGAAQLVRRALDAAGVAAPAQALERFLDIYDRRLLETTTAYPGVPEALALASPRARLAVLTNKPLGPSRRILAALGLLERFDAVIGGDSPLGRKPDPAGLHHLMADAPGLPTLLVGDSPIDEATAARAGVDFVFARYGFGAVRFTRPPAARFEIDRPADLAAVLDRVLALSDGA